MLKLKRKMEQTEKSDPLLGESHFILRERLFITWDGAHTRSESTQCSFTVQIFQETLVLWLTGYPSPSGLGHINIA